MQPKLEWKLRRIHLQNWISSIVKRFKEQAWNQKQILHFSISGTLSLFTFDDSCLELILIGLLNNACQHTLPREKIAVSIGTNLRTGCPDSEMTPTLEQWLYLKVSYCGTETPASELLQVLDQFYPTSSDLGLVLVKTLVDKLEGTIWVESTPTQTCFTVMLPGSSLLMQL